ncbi:hypothetical protein Q7P37_002874 [Cladosporium fusiforme]
MPPPSAAPTLKDLAIKLATQGPVRALPTPRLIRLLFNGAFIAQTTTAVFVWEHPYYPQYYIPASSLISSKAHGFTAKQGEEIKTPDGATIAHEYTLTVGSRSTSACVIFTDDLTGPGAVLSGMAKVDFNAMDKWFEESTPIAVHPKDPFKRVDIVQSTRRVQVFIDEVKVADTRNSMHLYETGLPSRFYLPLTDVEVGMLRPSKTRTQCPYKGEAEYYSVDTGKGKLKEDVVWFYERPTLESAKVEGLLCFYNEKVNIKIDDEWLETPKSPWS